MGQLNESCSEVGRANMAPQAHKLLTEQSPEAACEDRGRVEIKGKGKMHCWFLTGVGELVLGGGGGGAGEHDY